MADVTNEEVEYGIVEQPQTLSREAILAANDCLMEWVDVPTWGGRIQVRGLTVREIDSIMRLSTHKNVVNTTQSAVLMFVRACVQPKFTDLDVDDLKGKSGVVFQVVKVISRLSGIGAEAAEEMEKN